MKILLADDHALLRCGLARILRGLDQEVEVIEAGTCAQMLAAMEQHRDLALAVLDIRMPDGDGLDVLMQRRRTLPVVVLSASENHEDMQRAFNAGASGFMPKTISPAVMIGGLQMVLAGGVFVPPEMILAPIPREAGIKFLRYIRTLH